MNLLPGDVCCCVEPTLLTTVLGSCISVCLWDRRLRIGGMNHYVLPSDHGRRGNTRYGDEAMEQLVHGLVRHGCRINDLHAKVFGGANVLPCRPGHSVGDDNTRFAIRVLQGNRIPIVSRRTGGTRGQQIRFYTATGEVLIRVIKATLDQNR